MELLAPSATNTTPAGATSEPDAIQTAPVVVKDEQDYPMVNSVDEYTPAYTTSMPIATRK